MQFTSNYNLKKPDGTDVVNIQDLNDNADIIDTQIKSLNDNKVDKVIGMGLSSNDYTTTEKNKLAGIATGANNYVHPSSHPPSIIAQDANNRFVTDAEKATWNAKAGTAVATTSADGLMSKSDKAKIDGVATGSQANQNAFSTVKVGTTTVDADSPTDTLELVAGTGITLTPDATNDKVTITGTAATTSAAGVVQLNTATNSTSTTQAATPSAVKAVNDSLTTHIGDTTKHITAAERTAWNAKADQVTLDAHLADYTQFKKDQEILYWMGAI